MDSFNFPKLINYKKQQVENLTNSQIISGENLFNLSK